MNRHESNRRGRKRLRRPSQSFRLLEMTAGVLVGICSIVAAVSASSTYSIVMPPSLDDHPAVVAMVGEVESVVEREGWGIDRTNQPTAGTDLRVEFDPDTDIPATPYFTFSRADNDFVIRGSSPTGIAAGLAWLADRIAATGEFPSETTKSHCAFERHYVNAPSIPDSLGDNTAPNYETVRSQVKKQLDEVVLYGGTDILTYGRNQMIWLGESPPPEDIERRRAAYREFIRLAHEYGLRVFLVGDELVYHPDWVEAFDASLCTKDPRLWEMIRGKFRNFFEAVPEVDGILVRTGEVIPRGNLRSFDLVHHRCEKEKRSFEFIYQQIIQTIHSVAVGEFGKEYIHRTWVTGSHEQHSIEDVYRRIFTQEIPTENLTVSIKLTRTDQWQFQQLNPTLGLSPHRTNVEVETARFQRRGAPIMDFAAERVASGLQFALHRGASSVSNSISYGDSPALDAARYMIWRFSWNPDADAKEVVTDWAARQFGRKHAERVAEVCLSLDNAVRNTWYVRPLAVTHWNPCPHVYVDRFALKGLPPWDLGAGQDRFLYELYLQAKPWIKDTLEEMHRGISIWIRARDRFAEIAEELRDKQGAETFLHDLQRGTYALELNRAYMTTVFACYRYRENPTEEKHARLGKCIVLLKTALEEHKQNDGFYGTTAIEVFLDIASRIHRDVHQVEMELAEAPEQDEIHEMMVDTSKRDAALLAEHPEAYPVFRWSATVDGREVLHVSENSCRIEHLVADPPGGVKKEFLRPFPKTGRYVLNRIEGRGYVYLIEPPAPENDMTAKIIVDDPLPSSNVHRFELCVIPER